MSKNTVVLSLPKCQKTFVLSLPQCRFLQLNARERAGVRRVGEEAHEEGHAQVRHEQVLQQQLRVGGAQLASKVGQVAHVQHVLLGGDRAVGELRRVGGGGLEARLRRAVEPEQFLEEAAL